MTESIVTLIQIGSTHNQVEKAPGPRLCDPDSVHVDSCESSQHRATHLRNPMISVSAERGDDGLDAGGICDLNGVRIVTCKHVQDTTD